MVPSEKLMAGSEERIESVEKSPLTWLCIAKVGPQTPFSMVHPWIPVAQIVTSVCRTLICPEGVSKGLDDYLGPGKESDLVEDIV